MLSLSLFLEIYKQYLKAWARQWDLRWLLRTYSWTGGSSSGQLTLWPWRSGSGMVLGMAKKKKKSLFTESHLFPLKSITQFREADQSFMLQKHTRKQCFPLSSTQSIQIHFRGCLSSLALYSYLNKNKLVSNLIRSLLKSTDFRCLEKPPAVRSFNRFKNDRTLEHRVHALGGEQNVNGRQDPLA